MFACCSILVATITCVKFSTADLVSRQNYQLRNVTKWTEFGWKREKRDTNVETNWEDVFPIVHDYFYESDDDEYIGNTDYGDRPFNRNFRSLCQSVRKRVELRSDLYEYRPSHYLETVCKRFSSSDLSIISRDNYNQMCLEPGFTCVQRVQTIYLTRRRYDRDCWETAKEIIATGCDCMWPNIPIQTISENSDSDNEQRTAKIKIKSK